MQMKALRSENFAKLSSSNSTRDVYWVTSISAGTPAGYCLSQMRSMLFPLRFNSSAAWDGTPRWAASVPGSIEQCGGRWQGARARPAQGCSKKGAGSSGRILPSGARRGGLLIRWPGVAGRALGFDRRLGDGLWLCRLGSRLVGHRDRFFGGLRGAIRFGTGVPDGGRVATGFGIGLGVL